MEDRYIEAVKKMASAMMKDIPENLVEREATIEENDGRMNDFIKYNKNIYDRENALARKS